MRIYIILYNIITYAHIYTTHIYKYIYIYTSMFDKMPPARSIGTLFIGLTHLGLMEAQLRGLLKPLGTLFP